MNCIACRVHYRTPLLVLLSIVGTVLWSECASLNLAGDSQTGMFPKIEGWERSGEVRVYAPGTLYEYINGAAVGFLAYDFQDLHVAEYTRKPQASVLVEIYRHRTPAHAFGIYSQERPRVGSYLDIGAQGYLEVPLLNFIIGDYYVKINGMGNPPASKAVLETVSNALVTTLGGSAELPAVLACFPEELQQPNSEMFVASNFLGYGFLHSGYTADYRLDDQDFRLFIIEGADRQDCLQMLERYAEFTKYTDTLEEGPLHTLSDPYHGKITLAWKGNYIWGALNLTDSQQASRYLSLVRDKLDRLLRAG